MIDFEQTLDENYLKLRDKGHIFEKKDGGYQGITYGEFLDRTRGFAEHLLSLGLADKSIMLYGENSSKYMMADLAVLLTAAAIRAAVRSIPASEYGAPPGRQCVTWNMKLKSPCRKPLPAQNEAYSLKAAKALRPASRLV